MAAHNSDSIAINARALSIARFGSELLEHRSNHSTACFVAATAARQRPPPLYASQQADSGSSISFDTLLKLSTSPNSLPRNDFRLPPRANFDTSPISRGPCALTGRPDEMTAMKSRSNNSLAAAGLAHTSVPSPGLCVLCAFRFSTFSFCTLRFSFSLPCSRPDSRLVAASRRYSKSFEGKKLAISPGPCQQTPLLTALAPIHQSMDLTQLPGAEPRILQPFKANQTKSKLLKVSISRAAGERPTPRSKSERIAQD